MNRIKTLLMAIVLVAAGVFVWRQEHTSAPDASDGKTPVKVLSGISGRDLSALSVVGSNGSYAVEKSSANGKESWMMQNPPGAKADSQKLAAIVLSLSRLMAQNVIEPDEVEGRQSLYGLEPPELVLTVSGPFGKRVFSFGKKVQFSGRRYLQPENDGRIFLVEDGIFSMLNSAPSDIREHKPVEFDPSAVAEIDLLKSNGETMVFTREQPGVWKAKTPADDFYADGKLIEEKLLSLKNLKASEFVDESETDLAAFGLAIPKLIVSLKFADPATNPLSIGFGEGAPPAGGEMPESGGRQKKYYFKLLDGRFLYQLAAPVFNDLLSSAEFFRPRTPWLGIDRQAVLRVEAAGGTGETIVFERAAPAEAWSRSDAGAAAPASADQIACLDALLEHALQLRVLTYYPVSDMAQSETGLTASKQSVKIFLKDRSAPILLVIGSAVEDRQSGSPDQAHENPRWIAVTQSDGKFFPGMISSLTYQELTKDLAAALQR